MIRFVAAAVVALLVPTAAFAQAATESPVQDPAEQTDLLDVWHQFRHKPTEPEKRPEAQGVMIAAISSSVNSVSYSTKHQTLVNVRFDVFTSENRWFVEGDNRFYESGQTVYGLGADTPSSAGVDATYDFFRLHDSVYRHLGSGLYLGAGLYFDSHSSIAPADVPQEAWDASAFVGYSQAHGLTANGLLGVVAFANTATVTNLTAGERLFDSFAPAIGGGLRVLFNKRSRTNFCIDVAYGKAGAQGVYFAIQDAF